MKRLLAVFAHPDDEGAIAGTLAHYAGQGVEVSLVSTTKGEAGEISDPGLAKPENLGDVREAELRCACEILGVSNLFLLDYCDSGMEGTPENELETAFIRADPENVRRKLVSVYRKVKPQVVITFEPFGWYGHPDHKATGRYATEAFTLAGDASRFPGSGEPWQPQRLFHAVFKFTDFDSIKHQMHELGLNTRIFEEIPAEVIAQQEAIQATHVVDSLLYREVKERAYSCHRTQIKPDDPIQGLPEELRGELMRWERFVQVFPPPDGSEQVADDLFAGLEEVELT